jgi:hypothetical protein
MQQFCTMFHAKIMSLTVCFRCPKRIVLLAQHLQSAIKPSKDADLGTVNLCVSSKPWQTTESLFDCCFGTQSSKTQKKTVVPFSGDRKPQGLCEVSALLCQTNRPIIEYLTHMYHKREFHTAEGTLRWLSPTVQTQLEQVLSWLPGTSTLKELVQESESLDHEHHGPLDITVSKVLQTGVDLDGPNTPIDESRWLTFVGNTLRNTKGSTVLATIHASKGLEFLRCGMHVHATPRQIT